MPFSPFSSLKDAIGLGLMIAVAAFAVWAFRVDHLRAGWKTKTETITSAVGTAIGNPHLKPEDAPAAVNLLATNLRTCRTNNASLEAGISDQNAALEAMRRDGAARLAALDQVASQARADAQTARQRADAILAHRGTGNHCADADALILENAQ